MQFQPPARLESLIPPFKTSKLNLWRDNRIKTNGQPTHNMKRSQISNYADLKATKTDPQQLMRRQHTALPRLQAKSTKQAPKLSSKKTKQKKRLKEKKGKAPSSS